jgi:hypothetical protein
MTKERIHDKKRSSASKASKFKKKLTLWTQSILSFFVNNYAALAGSSVKSITKTVSNPDKIPEEEETKIVPTLESKSEDRSKFSV